MIMKSMPGGNHQNATFSGPRPGDFPVGSPESRAAARALLARFHQQDPTRKLRFVVTGSWEPLDDMDDRATLGDLDLSKSTCSRVLCPDGTLSELIQIHGDWKKLTDQQLEEWIAKFPIGRC